jgi:hypothetical protein
MERPMGLEPTPGPWQGPVLPLYYGAAAASSDRKSRSNDQAAVPGAMGKDGENPESNTQRSAETDQNILKTLLLAIS